MATTLAQRVERARRVGQYEHHREPILLAMQDGLSDREIALRMGMSRAMLRLIISCLGLGFVMRRSRGITKREAVEDRVSREMRELARQREEEIALVYQVRSFTTGWDRGW